MGGCKLGCGAGAGAGGWGRWVCGFPPGKRGERREWKDEKREEREESREEGREEREKRRVGPNCHMDVIILILFVHFNGLRHDRG